MRKVEFTETEIEIIKLICKQLTAKEIAEKLDLSYRTIEDYRLKIQKKVRAKNIVGIALYAIRKGIVK